MERKYLVIIYIVIVALILPAIAKQENLTLGPYKVSFDMGIDDLMNWVVSGPINSESMDGGLTTTQYSAKAGDLTSPQFVSESKRLGHSPNSNVVLIGITQYNTTQSTDDTRKSVEAVLSHYTDTIISERTIDGRRGAIGSGITGTSAINGLPTKMYVAIWYMDNNTQVYLSSFSPWDEGTLALLKTIHIEKINTTS
jgi:hypothetical protein